jgi:DNA-binding transcriptional LysR family regulator
MTAALEPGRESARMLDLVKLRMFQIVAVTQSFTRAAAELGCSQSNVTMGIKSLEKELGAQLFDRVRFSKKVVLTEVGQRTLDYAERLLALADETRVAIHQETEPVGPLRVSATESLLTYRLPGLLHRFQTLYPQVELGIRSGFDSEMTNSVIEGVTDLAFVVDEPVHSRRLLVGPLLKEELVIVASPYHESAREGELKTEDLAHAHVLLTNSSCSTRSILDRILSKAQVKLESTLEVGSVEAVKQCAIAEMGIAVLPKIVVAAELEEGKLVRLNWVGPALAIYTQMLRSRERWTSPALTALWNLANKTLGTEFAHQP